MNSEYTKNQKKQRNAFNKYRKYIKKGLLWGGVGIISALIFPWKSVFTFAKGLIGESLATSITFFSQWGIAGLGLAGAMVNSIKALRERKKIDDAQDDEENIIDGMVNETDKLQRQVKDLERMYINEKEKKETNVKSVDDKEKENLSQSFSDEDEVAKKYVR